MTFDELVYTLLTTYWYYRTEKHMICICKILEDTLKAGTRPYWVVDSNESVINEDMDTIWGTLVCGFGSFGTSPRYGWIKDIDIQPALTVIQEFKESCEQQCSESEE